MTLHRSADGISSTDSDKHGNAEELAAVIDDGLIEELVDSLFLEAAKVG